MASVSKVSLAVLEDEGSIPSVQWYTITCGFLDFRVIWGPWSSISKLVIYKWVHFCQIYCIQAENVTFWLMKELKQQGLGLPLKKLSHASLQQLKYPPLWTRSWISGGQLRAWWQSLNLNVRTWLIISYRRSWIQWVPREEELPPLPVVSVGTLTTGTIPCPHQAQAGKGGDFPIFQL